MYLEQNSIGKHPKDFEASGFPSCILNNTHFFQTSHRNQKHFMMSGKVGTFSNGICKRYFFIIRIICIKLQSYSLCYRQTKQGMQKIHVLLSHDLYVRSVKTTTYICSRFNTYFCTKGHKTYQAISCYTLLQQAARGKGKNSLRKRRDILVSDCDQQRFFIII